MKRTSKDNSKKTDAYDMPMPFMDDEVDKEEIMNLNERLMENRADATLHRGRDPTDGAKRSDETLDLINRREYHRKISHLKEEKQKMYFKQFSRAWEELKRSGRKKDTLFPKGTEPPEDTNASNSSDPSVTNTTATEEGGVNAYDSG